MNSAAANTQFPVFPVRVNLSPPPSSSVLLTTHKNHYYNNKRRKNKVGLLRIKSSTDTNTNTNTNDSAEQRKFPFKLPPKFQYQNWKNNFADINTDAVKEKLNTLLSNTQNFVNAVVASPLSKNGHPDDLSDVDSHDIEDIFVEELTFHSDMLDGNLSLAAVASIEQFSRMNGLTGKKMQKLFGALVPKPENTDARSLVEYCCFRFLSRDNSDIHPCLEDLAFQRLIFITMLAWENPQKPKSSSSYDSEMTSLKTRLVGEDAFLRIAPAISGVADRSTVHNLYKALAGDKGGISFGLWSSYIRGLLKVHKGRRSYVIEDLSLLPYEQVLCVGSSRKQPVLKWENNFARPGKLILTDKALYFEPIGLREGKGVMRLDISGSGAQVKKKRVGLLGSELFDSAVSVSSGEENCEAWVLEFIDFGGEMRRDVWHSSINEVIALHKFVCEFGPKEGDHSVFHLYGAHKGRERATTSAICSISRLQALQSIRKLIDDPLKLVQFSYLQYAPYGDIVCQTLALSYWGGPFIAKLKKARSLHNQMMKSSEFASTTDNHVYDIDGSVYLRQWMRSESWNSSKSISFWKNAKVRQGIVLSKNLVVGGTSLTERAAAICRDKSQLVEKTQATIDAATLEGIPSNIDLFKELVLPLTVIVRNYEKLRRWEEPVSSISFLALVYTIIFRNLLSYVFPVTLMIAAASMLLLKGLKEQGRLGRLFGKITIYDQPPSNTFQKIIALKKAISEMESYIQNINVTLLKLRTIILSGQPQITQEVALVLLSSAVVLLIVPFKFILAFLVFDIFTRELKFRREMVLRFNRLLKDRWETIPATPVVVLPFEEDDNHGSSHQRNETGALKE